MSASEDTISETYFGIQNDSNKLISIFPVASSRISSFTNDMIKLKLDDGTFVDINLNTLIIKFGGKSYGFNVSLLSADEIEALGSTHTIHPPRVFISLKADADANKFIIFQCPVTNPTKIKPIVREAKSLVAILVRGFEAAKRNSATSGYKSVFERERKEQMAKMYAFFSNPNELAEAGINISNNSEFTPAEENNAGNNFEEKKENNGGAAGGAGAGPARAPAAPVVEVVSGPEGERLAAAAEMRRRISDRTLDNKFNRMLLLQVLGIQKLKANPGEIKKAYRDLILAHHPDKGGNEEKFKNVEEAYSRLMGKSGGRRTLKHKYGYRKSTRKI